MNLKRTSFYTSITAIISFIGGFLITKVVAVKIGPEGIAYLGQFQNTVAVLNMIATGAVALGVIKYLAEFKAEHGKKDEIIGTAFVILGACSFFVSLVVILFSGYLSDLSFGTSEYRKVYLIYGLFSLASAFNILFPAILNGLKEIRWLTIVNISNSVAGIVITLILTHYYGVTGALVSSSIQAVSVLLVNMFICRKLGIKINFHPSKFHADIAKKLMGFSFMAAVSGIALPLTQILVRNAIIEHFSLKEAGYWQAITKVSDFYLAFVTSVLSVYYMPRLSEINNKPELRKEIAAGYRLIMPIVMAMSLLIWLLRGLVIEILFTPDFLPAKSYFTFQLTGDVFKIGSWLLAYLMLAKALTWQFIVTEILFALSFFIFSYLFMSYFGVIGVTYAFALNYGIYWFLMWWLLKKQLY